MKIIPFILPLLSFVNCGLIQSNETHSEVKRFNVFSIIHSILHPDDESTTSVDTTTADITTTTTETIPTTLLGTVTVNNTATTDYVTVPGPTLSVYGNVTTTETIASTLLYTVTLNVTLSGTTSTYTINNPATTDYVSIPGTTLRYR